MTTADTHIRCMAHVQRVVRNAFHLHMQNKSFHVYSNRSSRILFARALLICYALMFNSMRACAPFQKTRKSKSFKKILDADAFSVSFICYFCWIHAQIHTHISIHLMILISHGRRSFGWLQRNNLCFYTAKSWAASTRCSYVWKAEMEREKKSAIARNDE